MTTPSAMRAALLLTSINLAVASPISKNMFKRDLTSGAKAGLGIGIAVAIIIVGLIIVFFVLHMRKRAHHEAINNQRAILAGEKNPDGTDKFDKFAPEPSASGIPRRNKSVKDRLMGPLYRGSMIDLPPVPRAFGAGDRRSTMNRDSFLSKPWSNSGENSPRPSFSSKRATRMMMMM